MFWGSDKKNLLTKEVLKSMWALYFPGSPYSKDGRMVAEYPFLSTINKLNGDKKRVLPITFYWIQSWQALWCSTIFYFGPEECTLTGGTSSW